MLPAMLNLLTPLSAGLLGLPGAVAPNTLPAPTSNDLLSAIPDTAVFAVHGANPKALIASRDTSNWVAFALDAEWDTVISEFAWMADDEAAAEEIQEWRQMLIGAMADTTGFVGFLDFTGDEPAAGLIAQGGAECAALLRQTVGEDATSTELAGGRTALVGEEGRAELFYEAEGLIMILSSDSIEQSKALAASCLDRLGNAAPAGPFAVEGLAAHRKDAAFEFAADFGAVWAKVGEEEVAPDGIERRLFESVSSVEWLYGSMSFGDGEVAGMEIVAPFAPKSLLGEALGFFGKADTGLFSTVPAAVSQASVISFDIGGFSDWVLDVVKGVDEDVHAQVTGGIEGAGGMIGLDIRNEFIGQFTGQALVFNSNESIVMDGTPLPFSQAPTAVLFMEETEPIIDVVDQLLELMGAGAMMTSDTRELPNDAEVELWMAADGTSSAGGVGVGAGRMIFSLAPKAMGSYLDLVAGKDGAKSMLTNKALAAAAGSAQGAVVSVQSTASMADFLSQATETYEAFMADLMSEFGDEGESTEMAAMRSGAERIAGLVRQYFKGTTTTEFTVEDGLMRVATRSR